MGGAFATPSKALAVAVSQNIIWIKAGTYTVSANPTYNAANSNQATSNRITGYNATRGDNPTGSGRPTLQATGTTTTVLSPSSQGWRIAHLIIDCNNVANIGVQLSGQYNYAWAVKVTGFKQYGLNLGAQTHGSFCEVTGGISGASAGIFCGSAVHVFGCYVHDNPCTGIQANSTNQPSMIHRCVVANNSGSTSDGVLTDQASSVIGCTIHGNGRDGIRTSSGQPVTLMNNLLTGNGGYGLNMANFARFAAPEFDNNAYHSNTAGTRNGCGTGTADVILTASPYVNSAAGDYSLNATAGGGAACRAAGLPGAFPAGLVTGYPDLGAVQHQDAGGGGGGSIFRSPLFAGVS
jgi:hypothetical protein